MEIMSDEKLKIDNGRLSSANSQLKKGYKQTEVGVVPDDWEVYTINQLIEENIIEKPLDGNHGNIHPTSKDYVSDGIPFVMSNNIYDGTLDFKNCHFIKKEQADKLQKGFSVTGDVLLTHKGTIGNTAIVGEISTDYIMLTPQVTYYRVKNCNRIINSYVRYYFDSQKFQSILVNLSGGGTRAYIGITNQKKLPFVLPSLREQNAISQILIDTDALINTLDALIRKKRSIKQGAMQQLLTGKKRLPGFTEDWEEEDLQKVTLSVVSGKSKSKSETGLFPLYGSTGIIGYHKSYDYEGQVILVARVGANSGTLNIAEGKYCVSDNTLIIRFNNKYEPRFFYYELLNKELNKLAFGSGQPLITGGQLKKLKIPLPSRSEQQAIAKILSDIDAEIESLEQQREKTKLIKQGMMQELLTGKTRLI